MKKRSSVSRLREDISECIEEMPEFVQEAAGKGASEKKLVIQALYQVAAQQRRYITQMNKKAAPAAPLGRTTPVVKVQRE